MQPDPRVGVGSGGVHPRVAGILALGLEPRVVGLLVAPGPQQVGDQRPRAGMIIELAVPAGGNRRSQRVDRLIEAAQPFVGVRELVEIPRAVRLRLVQRERGGDQPNARVVVIMLAGRVQLVVDPLKIPHARRLAGVFTAAAWNCPPGRAPAPAPRERRKHMPGRQGRRLRLAKWLQP